jgi:hypothetical protein
MYKHIHVVTVMNKMKVTMVEPNATASIFDGIQVSLPVGKTRFVGVLRVGVVVVAFRRDVGDGVVKGSRDGVVEGI